MHRAIPIRSILEKACLTILIVDDEQINHLCLSLIIKKVMKNLKTKIEIISCNDGPTAIELFQSMNYPNSENFIHLIIVDMNMVPMNGV